MSDVVSILPSNSTRIERAIEYAMRSKIDLSVISKLMDPDQCPEHLLPWLAWALSVDFWDDNWSIEARRQVVRESVQIHRRMGTAGSVRRALVSAGFASAKIVERYGWERYDGQHIRDGSINRDSPDHWAEFRVDIPQAISIEQAHFIRAMLEIVAPAHCHLRVLNFTQAANIYNGKIARNGAHTRGHV